MAKKSMKENKMHSIPKNAGGEKTKKQGISETIENQNIALKKILEKINKNKD